MKASFGKGDKFWTNVFPTTLLARHQKEIKRFCTMLSIVRWFEVFFAMIPIKYLMKLFWFSDEFANAVALPMVALFLGTGNYAPEVPTIILERLCTSPTYGMWYPADKQSIASNLPPMVVFPNFSIFYEDWRKNLVKKGVNVRLSTELTRVVKRDMTGVVVRLINRTPVEDQHNPDSSWVPGNAASNADANAEEVEEEYDELVLCVLYVSLCRTSSWADMTNLTPVAPTAPTPQSESSSQPPPGAKGASSAAPNSPTTSPSPTQTAPT